MAQCKPQSGDWRARKSSLQPIDWSKNPIYNSPPGVSSGEANELTLRLPDGSALSNIENIEMFRVALAYLHYPGKGKCDYQVIGRLHFMRQKRKEQEYGIHRADCDWFAKHRATARIRRRIQQIG